MGGKQRRDKRERDTQREVGGEGKKVRKEGERLNIPCTELFPSACLPKYADNFQEEGK